MGECMSICGSRNAEEEEPNPIYKEPIKVIDVHAPSNQTINSNTSHPSIIKRTKKNKTRIPKNVMFKDEEEIIYPDKEREKSMMRFEEMSDEKIDINALSDEEKSEEKYDNFHENNKNMEKEEEILNQEKVDKKLEIISTDIPQNLQKAALSENKSKESEMKKDELIIDNKNNYLKEEKDTNNIQHNYNEINNNENNIVEVVKEEKVKNVEEGNNEIIKKIKDKEDEKNEEENKDKEEEKKKEIKEEHVEKEEEKDKEEFINNGIQKEVIIPKEEDINENEINIEKKENIINNEILRNKPNKNKEIIENKKQQIIKEEKNEEKGGKEENVKKNVKNEEDIEKKILNSEKEKKINNGERLKEKEDSKNENIEMQINDEKSKVEGEEEEEEDNNEGEDDDNQKLNFLEKYKTLTEIININLEVNGLGKLSIKNRIDDLYKSLSDSESSDSLISRLSDLLIELMNICLDSDKTIIKDFCKDLIVLFNGDQNKIYKQIMEFIERINEQEKLTTRKSNRIIRTYIQDSKDKLKKRLREEDIPSDKIISYELFYKIVKECEIKLKEEHMDVLLYQMKKAVPKGRYFNTFNAIVVLDFLK